MFDFIDISKLPTVNAFFNSLSFICLMCGWVAIKNKKKERHASFMIAALIFSTFFLASYLIYHFSVPSKVFPNLGAIKIIYLTILFTHVVLAIIMVPMIIMTFYRAFTGNFEKHKKMAKVTFPIWCYVSVTGVIIYLMLYRFY